MTKWTAPDIASIRGDNSRPLQKIFGSLTEYLKDYQNTIDTSSSTSSQTFVRNGEATTLTIGTVVYLDAQQGDRATVKRAYNTSDATSAKTLGVVAESIPANADGLVTTLGYLEKVNTSAFTAGQTLYLGATAGTFTATKPVAPNHMVYVGVVIRANAGNGIIYVRCQNGYELDEIHDVLITSPATGNILMRNGSNLWINTPQTSITSVGTLSSLTVTGESTFNSALNVTTVLASGRGLNVKADPTNAQGIIQFTNNAVSAQWSSIVATNNLLTVSTPLTVTGTMTATTFSGSGASLTTLNASNLSSGTVASARISGSYTGITGIGSLSTDMRTTAGVIINNGSPTIYLQDSDNRSSMIHCNSNIFYVLRGSGTNSTTFTAYNGYWPLQIDLENNNATFGGTIFSAGTATSARFITNNASPSLELGDWSSSSTWSAVDGYNGYLLLGNTSDRACYLRSNNAAAVNIGANGTNTLVVNNGNIVVNGTTANSTLNVIGGTGWFSAMGAGSGPTVQNYFGFLVYVSSRLELKDNIVTVSSADGLDRILALRPVEFTMKPEYVEKANEYTPFDVKRGFIAQETAEVDHIYAQWGWVDENQKMATVPALDGELPLEDATPIYWNHDALIADLVASIQNINKRLTELEAV